jgi:hypothetical protein
VKLSRVARIPVPRVALGVLVAAVVLTGGLAARLSSGSCQGSQSQCANDGIVRWSRALPGSWIADNAVEGTVLAEGQAYAAAGEGVAVIGFGRTVNAYEVTTGFPRWAETLTGLPAGSAIVSVRAFRGVVTIGVAPASGLAGDGTSRQEVVLDGTTGKQLRTYPAARSGGTVWASPQRTVIVGQASVTSYANATGRAVWRDPTGPAEQAWRVAGRKLYVTVSARGQVGTAPVTAVRQIDLRTGSERLIRSPLGSFDGTLTGVVNGVLVFSGSSGLSTYSLATGHLIGHRPGAVVEGTDTVRGVLYADIGGALTGIDPVTGRNVPGAGAVVPSGSYGVRAGVALGLDPGSNGAAWGYSIAKRHIIWTARSLPWPHYFDDSSGIGGAVDASTGTVLLVTCAAAGQPVHGTVVGGDGQACLKPRLVALGPWGATS